MFFQMKNEKTESIRLRKLFGGCFGNGKKPMLFVQAEAELIFGTHFVTVFFVAQKPCSANCR
ncbi:MAG: hypothetical protein LBL62_04580 [Planctomycetaceae bacterium]|nr:hypothetical protein [Planctomycetaceae bacterium]